MRKNLGLGVGLRHQHYEHILTQKKQIDWFEIISENFMGEATAPLKVLEKILANYPIVLHGVNLCIGSLDPLNWDYLKALKKLIRLTDPPWVSDHLSWGRLNGAYYHDLLPLPKTEKIAYFVAKRAQQVQDFLEVPFALENVSSYLSYQDETLSEPEFCNLIAEQSNTWMLVDVNNIYVTCYNLQLDPYTYLKKLNYDRIIQIHLAGHRACDGYLFDSHDAPVSDPVWSLYHHLYAKTPVSTLLEWDDALPSYSEVCHEIKKAHRFQASCIA